MTNVTARHGKAAVHLGGHEYTNGRWSPVCRIQHDNCGGREVTPLRPTEAEVDCKRCLKVIDKQTQVIAVETRRQQAKTAPKPVKRAAAKTRQFYSPEIERTEKSGIDSLRDMLKLY